MKIYIDLIHSYQYLKKRNYILSFNKFIIDKDNNKLIGLCNIPKHPLYKVLLQKIDNSNNENLKIMVRIDFKSFYSYVKNGKNIPDRDKFFRLIRRTFFNKKNLEIYLNQNLDFFNMLDKNSLKKNNYKQLVTQWINKIENKKNEFTFLNNDTIKIHNIYIDTRLERFYLENEKKLLEKKLYLMVV